MSESPPPSVFIDESAHVIEGEEAEALIRERSEREEVFLKADSGIAAVDRARWEEAQRYERRTWMESGVDLQGDRNRYHQICLGGYSALRKHHFARAIELGCGPFTNMRIIHECCRIDHMHLLDPLLNDYLRHPYCQYTNGRLGGGKRLLGDVFRWRDEGRRLLAHPWQLPLALYKALSHGGWKGAEVTLVPSMIEECKAVAHFDLVVMVNVLEHCQDGHAVLQKILELTTRGSILVFGDLLFDVEKIKQTHRKLYDVGHPLRIDGTVIRSFLAGNFQELHRCEKRIPRSFHDIELEDNELYFIGTRV
ncbi:MAG: hypothetical protein K9N51_07940 [Candidatus Pacebacteria bacterium]|nr:hypothetical protein [Candidatus Paceibacterota bacterium]